MPRIDHAGEFREMLKQHPGLLAPGGIATLPDARGNKTVFVGSGGGTTLSLSGSSSGTPTTVLIRTLNDTGTTAADARVAASELLEQVKARVAGTMHYTNIRSALRGIQRRFAGQKRLLKICSDLADAMQDKKATPQKPQEPQERRSRRSRR